MFNKLIRHFVIFKLKYSISGLLIILFVIFQILKESWIRDILEFSNRKAVHNQGKIFLEISIAIFIFYKIGGK